MRKIRAKKHKSPEKYLNQLLQKNQKKILIGKPAFIELDLLIGMAASCLNIENDLMLLKERVTILKEDLVYKKGDLSEQIDRVIKRLKKDFKTEEKPIKKVRIQVKKNNILNGMDQ